MKCQVRYTSTIEYLGISFNGPTQEGRVGLVWEEDVEFLSLSGGSK